MIMFLNEVVWSVSTSFVCESPDHLIAGIKLGLFWPALQITFCYGQDSIYGDSLKMGFETVSHNCFYFLGFTFSRPDLFMLEWVCVGITRVLRDPP